MPEAPRISAQDAEDRAASGQGLLVCAYDDDEKCRKYRIGGAIPLSELSARLSSLSMDRELMFYCA